MIWKSSLPLMDFQLFGHVAQTKSQNPLCCRCEFEGKNSTNAIELLMYIKTLIVASQ